MELRHLRYFVAVADELSFRRAAAKLKVAQPALSYQIATLESDLGAKLFSRDTRRIALTDAGRTFLDEARRVLTAAERAVEAVKSVQRGTFGTVRLGYTRFAGFQFLPRLLSLVTAAHPGINVSLRVGFIHGLIDDLEASALDLAILPSPVESALLDTKVLKKDPLVGLLPAGHRLARQPVLKLEEVRDEQFLMVSRRYGGPYSTLTLVACQSAGFIPRKIEYVDSLETAFGAVAAGQGIAFIPESIGQWATSDLAVMPLGNPKFAADLVMAWRKDEPSQICRTIVETIQRFRPEELAVGPSRPGNSRRVR